MEKTVKKIINNQKKKNEMKFFLLLKQIGRRCPQAEKQAILNSPSSKNEKEKKDDIYVDGKQIETRIK
jgi:hypothetical protein